MNTSKQVNVMVGLLMVFTVSTLLYFLWDTVRAEDAEERQLQANAERGGKLYSLNCRACHGLKGLGSLENATLPGAPLNIDDNRPSDPGKLTAKQQRIRDTIKCGRVGTVMPPWLQENGGALNEFQIEQLVLLITSAASEEGWEHALEEANHADLLGKQLAVAAAASDTTLALTKARGLKADNLLRINDEVVKIVDAPTETKLIEDAAADDSELMVDDAKVFQTGDIVQVEGEKVRVNSASGDLLRVERGVEDTRATKHSRELAVFEVGDQIEVERGAFSTQPAPHEASAEVYNGPIPPADTITGAQGVPPCGQRGVAPAGPSGPSAGVPTPSPGQPQRPAGAQEVQAQAVEPSNGAIETESKDSFFSVNSFSVKVGQEVTIRVSNSGQLPHNLRVAGLDGQWSNADDFVTDPPLLTAGQTGQFAFSLGQAATLVFRCDVHPTQMWGQITVAQ